MVAESTHIHTLYDVYAQPSGSYPRFCDFCTFVADEAQIACGPCNTRSAPELKRDNRSKTRANAQSLSTQAREAKSKEPPKPQCLYCTGDHVISRCSAFQGQDAAIKKDFAMKHALCFGCFRRNHRYRDCKSRNPSLMDNRKQVHLKEKPQMERKYTGEETKTAASVMSTATNSPEGILHTMILPVILSNIENPDCQIQTYPMLDNRSHACLIKGDLIPKLPAVTAPSLTELEITTWQTSNLSSRM